MLINTNRREGVIKIPEDFVKLIGIDKRGYFRYQITYQIQVDKAIAARANIARIDFAEDTPSLNQSTLFSAGNTPRVVVRNIRTQTSKQKDLLKLNNSKTFFSHISDFTRQIQKSFKSKIEPKKRHRKIFVKSAEESNTSNDVKPIVLQNKASTLDLESTRQSLTTKTLTHDFSGRKEKSFYSSGLTNFSLEPAMYLGQRTFNILSSRSARTGAISERISKKKKGMLSGKISKATTGLENFNSTTRNVFNASTLKRKAAKRRMRKLPRQMQNKVLSIQSQRQLINTVNPSNSQELDPDKLFTELITYETSFEEIKEVVDIPFGILNMNSFILKFSVIDTKGFEIQKVSRQVDHENLVSQYELPKEPPYLEVSPYVRNNKIIIELEQVDENAVGVSLYKRIVPTDEVITNSEFELIEKIPLKPDDGKIYYYDYISTTNPIIYRAMSYGVRKNLSGEFSSAVVLNKNKRSNNGLSFRKKQSFCSLTHRIIEKGVKLEIRNISPGPISLIVEKKDLSASDSTFSKIGATTLLTENSETIIITDIDVKQDRIYEYRCKLIYEDGSTEIANNSMVVEFADVKANVLNLLVSEPEIEKNNQEIDVKMTLKKDIILKKSDVIKSFLKEQGLSEEFADEIYKSRDQLQNLFFTRAIRQNLITGEEEEFGALKSNEFSDFEVGKVRNVKPLEDGGIYRYVFYTYARDVETMFDELTKIVEKTTSNDTVFKKSNTRYNPKEFFYSPAKWKHPVTLKHGNIVTNRSLENNHSKNEFTNGTLVDITYVDLSLVETKPYITNIQATNLDDYNNIITWEVDGDTSKIDHFILTVEISGIKDVVGKAHNIDTDGHYLFVDTLDNDEEGALTYYITPIYFDMSWGPQQSSNTIII